MRAAALAALAEMADLLPPAERRSRVLPCLRAAAAGGDADPGAQRALAHLFGPLLTKVCPLPTDRAPDAVPKAMRVVVIYNKEVVQAHSNPTLTSLCEAAVGSASYPAQRQRPPLRVDDYKGELMNSMYSHYKNDITFITCSKLCHLGTPCATPHSITIMSDRSQTFA